ncbi:MAG TPA: histidine triad nucleotide-binding protein [Tissierellia bacterium]|nr:histidine triad nucleotide-binding protein [Tissierellia bacterium]
MDCIFCKIANKEIATELVFENEYVAAFKDMAPQAPVHILAVPKIHISSMNEINKDNSHIIAQIFEAINKIAETQGIMDSGYRVISNCGEDGRQSVHHLHFHILGGKKLPDKLT